MPHKIYHSVNTFNAGELSELLFNREDISKYRSGCRILENAFPLVEGGAQKMPGTYFAGSTAQQTAPCRLVPFQFSTAQGAILELSPTEIRIWEPTSPGEWNLGLVLSGGNPLVLTTPYNQGDLFELDCGTQSADVLWIFHPDYPPACVERLGPSNWQYVTYPPGGPTVAPGLPAYRGTPGVVSTGYSALGVSILQMTQSYSLVMVTDGPFAYGDRIYINGCAGMVELNQGEFFTIPVLTTGTIATFTGQIDGGSSTQFGTILNVTSVGSGTIQLGMLVKGANVLPGTIITEFLGGSGGTGTYQVNVQQLVGSGTSMTGVGGYAYNLVGVGEGVLFTGSITGTTLNVTAVAAGEFHVGEGIYYPGVTYGTFIQSFGSGTGGTGTYILNISQSAGSQKMSSVPIASESYLTYVGGGFAVKVLPFFASTGDYPSCGTFYQERLCVGGSDNKPTTMYGSTQNDFPDFICDPNADDYAIQFTLISTLLDQIISMVGTPTALLLGTAGGIWQMSGSAGTSLSQTSVVASKQTTLGVGQLQPQLVGDAAVFVSRSAKTVMFLVYDFVSNQWGNYDLTRLNRQITIGANEAGSGVLQTAFQSEPYPIFWAVRADGQLLGLVFNRQDQVYAWFRINMLPKGGKIESVAVITGQNQEDMVVIEVQRTINGSVVRYVEYFMQQELFNQLSNAFFVHCGLQLKLGASFSITGITQANPPTVTAPGHNFTNGEFIQITDVLGMTEINQDKTQAYTVINSNTGAGTFQLQGMDTTGFSAYTSGGTALPVTNEVTGMNYLLGQEVVAVGDDTLILPPTVVSSDTMTFLYYCNQITIGLPYTTTIQPTNPVTTAPTHTTRGMKQKLNRVTLSMYQSMGGKFGTDPDHMYDITYGPGTKGKQPQMSTLEVTRDMDCDWSDESTFQIMQSDPFPFTLRGLVMRMSFNQD